ncbi:MAG: twin-arginine translocation signal domain-containing protein [Candidatus Promineifilaceae bacterium]|nr:twin-arginine translocation signal domain-containing protein [Candidatus Promineifilaceae bacterium]
MFQLPDERAVAAAKARSPAFSRHQQLHVQAARRGWTRRQFLKMGVALAGASGASLLPTLARAAPPGSGLPSQLPYTSPVLKTLTGLDIPFFLPLEVDPFSGANADPSTIADFNGFVGLVEAVGVSDADHNSDGVRRTWACDVRFMKGVFVNRAGERQPGAFGFF